MNSHQTQTSLTLNDLMKCSLSELPRLTDRYVTQENNKKEEKDSTARTASNLTTPNDQIKKFIYSRISPYTQMSIVALRISVLLSTQDKQPVVNITRMEANKKAQFKTIYNEFSKQLNADIDQLIELAEWIGREVTSAARSRLYSGQDVHKLQLASILSFWHAILDFEEKIKIHNATIERLVNLAPQDQKAEFKSQFSLLVKRFEELPALRNAYEKIQPIGLYVYRFDQYMTHKHRKIQVTHGWLEPKNINAIHITNFSKSCEEYRNAFKEIYYPYRVKKSAAFETICSLDKLLQLEDFPVFLASMQEELPKEVLDTILSWTAQAIIEMYEPHATLHVDDTSLSLHLPDSGTLVDFADLVGKEQILKELMQFANDLVIDLKNKNQLHTAIKVNPNDFYEHYKESQQKTFSFEEVKQIERRKQKAAEATLRQERKDEIQALAALSITQEFKERNLAAEAKKIETRKEELLERFKTMSSRRQTSLKSLLNPEVSADQHKEAVVVNTLEAMGLLEQTDKGYKVSFVASTHRDHSDGKVDGHFIADLRKYFLDHGITSKTLGDIIKAEKSTTLQK